MLGQKEICGLVALLCCCLANPVPSPTSDDILCMENLLQRAGELANASRKYYIITNNSESINAISMGLPSCEAQHERKHIVKAFYAVFQKLHEDIEGGGIKGSLQTNLQQQKECLKVWNVSVSPIDITYPETDGHGKKMFLIKASERYYCLMAKQNLS